MREFGELLLNLILVCSVVAVTAFGGVQLANWLSPRPTAYALFSEGTKNLFFSDAEHKDEYIKTHEVERVYSCIKEK